MAARDAVVKAEGRMKKAEQFCVLRSHFCDEINEAFAAMGGGQVGRGVIVF